jgi:hypothetical protein
MRQKESKPWVNKVLPVGLANVENSVLIIEYTIEGGRGIIQAKTGSLSPPLPPPTHMQPLGGDLYIELDMRN